MDENNTSRRKKERKPSKMNYTSPRSRKGKFIKYNVPRKMRFGEEY